jgi:hydrogenase expression/formation protein HypD
MSAPSVQWLERLRALNLSRRYKVMNVCGGHERTIAMTGLRKALPDEIELIPGPGCPVCICPEEIIYQAIQLAMSERVILAAFGDMLRVPVNVGKREVRTLEQARAAGADIVPVASPLQVVRIAQANPNRSVVFFAAGFETTTAPVAAMLAEGVPDNLSVLLAGRRTWPAVAMLLESGAPGFDALVAPGHVSTVMGPEEWAFVPEKHRIPTAVGGFTAESLVAALYSVLRQLVGGRCFLDNCYPEVVRPGGNPRAQRALHATMDVVDASWRGIGIIPASGYALREKFVAHDATRLYPCFDDAIRKRAGQMPPGCDCARVVLGRVYPDQCVLYGSACTPRTPIGPCMVSDEGACRIWWSSGVRTARQAGMPMPSELVAAFASNRRHHTL